MDYRQNQSNPLFKQHVVTCSRHVLIRQEQEAYQPIWHNRKVISINDTEAELTQMQSILPEWNTLFVLCLDDDSMTEEQARAIRDFVLRHHHDNFLVHCYLGASRSPAVAKWIAETLRIDDPELEAYVGYNQHVYDTLQQVSK